MQFKLRFARISSVGISMAIAALYCAVNAQTPPEKVGIGDQGNVWVTSEDGKRLTMADRDHCLESGESPDRLSMICLVSSGVADDGSFAPSFQLEIYRLGGHKLFLQPTGAIREWRFWNGGKQVAISFQASSAERQYALYDTASGNLIEKVQEPADITQLPQWAKSRAQVDDESVPTGPTAAEDHNKWLAKMMRQIGAIKPGMLRQDLAAFFDPDGGISFFGSPQRYVLKECPMIKIDVGFKTSHDKSMPDNPDDVIESVSKPYLEYPFAD